MSEFGYSTGFVNYNGTICVIGSSFELEEQDEPHAFIGIYRDGEWDFWEEGFNIISAVAGGAAFPGVALMVGRRGDVLAVSSSGEPSEELIDGKNGLPNQYAGLSYARKIDDYFFVIGMRRQVYRKKIASDQWERIDEGVVVPLASKDIEGFLSVDGISASEVYCGGYHGKLWKFNGSNWSELASPTNAIIETISCSPEKEIFVGGDDGLLMKGRNSQWTVLSQDITDDHIVTGSFCGDYFYFATEYGCVARYRDGVFEDVTPTAPDGSALTTGFLHSNDESVLSIGLKDIMLFKKNKWTRVPQPPFSL